MQHKWWWWRLSVELRLVSRHFKRTFIEYNNKLRAQHLRPLLDTDCRIKTTVIKQTEPLLLARGMHAGGAQLALLEGVGGGFFNVLGKRHSGMLCTNKPQLDGWCVSACVCLHECVGQKIQVLVIVCVFVHVFFLPSIFQVLYGSSVDHETTFWFSVKTLAAALNNKSSEV